MNFFIYVSQLHCERFEPPHAVSNIVGKAFMMARNCFSVAVVARASSFANLDTRDGSLRRFVCASANTIFFTCLYALLPGEVMLVICPET